MPKSITRQIGGYFELELPKPGELPYPGALKFQSARAAFLSLLRARMPRRVWLPKYLCDSMLVALQAAKIECIWYDLDSRLAVSSEVKLLANDLLLYVNYFGLQNKNIETLLKRFPAQQIVLDYSQAYFEPPIDGVLATIYSPRKFFGVPDGGLLVSKLEGIPLPEQEAQSLDRSLHLLKRLAGSAEDGYNDYKRAEESLMDCEPKRMSKLTERILKATDFTKVRNARHENFMYLHREFSGINSFEIDLLSDQVPLCYPFMTHDSTLRQRLIVNRIFIPMYWADAIARVGLEWSEKMIKNMLPLPVDQRYNCEDMQRVVSIIRERNL